MHAEDMVALGGEIYTGSPNLNSSDAAKARALLTPDGVLQRLNV